MDIMIRNYRATGEILTSSSTKAKTGELKAPSNRKGFLTRLLWPAEGWEIRVRFGGGKRGQIDEELKKRLKESEKRREIKRQKRWESSPWNFGSSNNSPKTTKRPTTQYTTRNYNNNRNNYQNSFSKYSGYKPKTTNKPPTQQTTRYQFNSNANYGRQPMQNEQDCTCD